MTAHARGCADLTPKVTGLGGRTATTALHYAVSSAVQHSADARCPTGAAGASATVDVGGGHVVVGDDEDRPCACTTARPRARR
ncbi:hypothetical protein [Streptomyces broussonetiae]|uniref:hypothetical protein n=1 Tax=Streptomyces broussonetiae TaxID=2686304 RepID=UPI0035E07BDC